MFRDLHTSHSTLFISKLINISYYHYCLAGSSTDKKYEEEMQLKYVSYNNK